MDLATRGKKKFTNKYFKIFFTGEKNFTFLKEGSSRFKILLIENGAVTFFLNGKKYFITSPSLLLLDELDNINIIEENNLSIKALFFHPDFINIKFDFENIRKNYDNFSLTEKQDTYLFDFFIKESLKIFISIPFENKLKDYFFKLESVLSLQEADCWSCHARCLLIELLFFLKNALNNLENIENDFNREKEEPVDKDKIISYLKLNYGRKISIEEMCRTFYTNRTTLSKTFKEETGMSLFNYLIKIRIEMAAMLLKNSILDVYEIMVKVGFNDLSHFIKMFKKFTGCTPTAFRKKETWITISKKDVNKLN